MNANDTFSKIRHGPPAEWVEVERPRCPACTSPRLKSNRSETIGVWVKRYTRCQSCGWKFKLLLK